MKDYSFPFHGYDSTRLLRGLIHHWIWQWEEILRRNREKAAIERLLQIAIVRAHWVMYCDEVCASGKGTLYHHLVEGGYD